MKGFTDEMYDRRLHVIPPSDKRNVHVFGAAGASAAQPIPAGAEIVLMQSDIDCWLAFGDNSVAAVQPVADVVDGSADALNQAGSGIAFEIPDGATYYSIAAEAAGKVAASFYAFKS